MAIPPPPPGFTLNAAPGAVPPPPPGFTLNQPGAAPAQSAKVLPPVSGVQHFKDIAGTFARHPFTAAPGMLENALSAVTGGVGAVADAVTLEDPGSHDWAYRPRTQAGQEIANLQGQEMTKVGQAYDRAAGTGPLAQTLKERVPQAVAAVSTVAPLVKIGALRGPKVAPVTAEQVVSRMESPQSLGAASAAPILTNVSPEFRQAIVTTARKTGGAINPEAFERQHRAESLLVPSRLTEGQALRDPNLISREQNQRGAVAEYRDQFAQQNAAMTGTMRELRERVGPDVFSTNPAEHGDTLISAYRARNDAAQTNISGLYDRLRNAAGGGFPVDSQALLRNASTQLHRDLLFEHAPKEIMVQLNRMAQGGMTFEQFEAMRTNLATLQRSPTAGGLEKRAAGVIRNAMEELPLGAAASQLKPYADAARGAARAQHRALDADPAYRAAVEGSVSPDQFVNRFVIRGSRDDVARMRQNLEDNPSAAQTLGVTALDHLRDQARLNPNYEGNFAAASYNKALNALNPKLRSLLSPADAEMLDQLGQFSTDATFQPRGSYVNNSNTFVAAAADKAATVAEKAGNAVVPGLDLGTMAREAFGKSKSRREARRATAPGAGLNRLRPVTTPSPKPVASNNLNVGPAQSSGGPPARTKLSDLMSQRR